jgi:ABC-type multidrug transport system fused ATPase/permease subunit
VVVSLAFHGLAVGVWTWGSIRASRQIHARLLGSVLSATFRSVFPCRDEVFIFSHPCRWLDVTPLSRIITRCTQDVQAFDSSVPNNFNWFIDALIGLGLKLVVIIPFAPVFLLLGICITAAGLLIGNIYMKAQVSVKRELAIAKAPVIHMFGSVLSGLRWFSSYFH